MKKLICGPMATLSHEAFRRSVEAFGGCDEYYTEMIHSSSLLTMGPFEKYYIINEAVPEKMVWQLTGIDAEKIAEAASLLCEKGGIGIDLNMGCSAPQIYKTGAGISWMLKDISETRKLVSSVKKVISDYEEKSGNHLRLSVKCRLGAEDFTEKSFFTFTDMLIEEGVELVALHPRTIKEKYRLEPKYEWIEKTAERYGEKLQLTVNGNIKDSATSLYVSKKCPSASGLMIARAAAGKPWIFAQIKTELESLEKTGSLPETKEHCVDRKKVALDFIDDVVKYQPEEFVRTRVQRFFEHYCQQFQFGHYFQSQMLNYHSVEESKNKVEEYFQKQSQEQFIYF